MEIGHGYVCFLASSYEGQDCGTCCSVSSMPQAYEGEVSILILCRCLFRWQCPVQRCVMMAWSHLSNVWYALVENCSRQGLFFPVESLSSEIESHLHLPLPFCLSFHFPGFRSKLVSIAGQLNEIGKAFLASWACQVTCLQLEPPRLILCL